MSSPTPPWLRFAWWNVNSFAHYDPKRAGERFWPLVREEYTEKCERVDNALRYLIQVHDPDLLGLGEITSSAAESLRARLFPDFKLVFPEVLHVSSFQVAVLYRAGTQIRKQLPLLASDVPRTTRSMAIVESTRADHGIAFVFCHWTAFGENATTYRERLADAASAYAYGYVNDPKRKVPRHVILLGDLNAEPFDTVFLNRLHASRDRDHSRRRTHPADRHVRRVRFYNTGWRLLGECYPHSPISSLQHFAGTYYNRKERAWHSYDQVLVTGGLLGNHPPYLDESGLGIRILPGCLGNDGKPEAFSWSNGIATGLSDHLPLTGRVILQSSE